LEIYLQLSLFVIFQVCFILQLYYLIANHKRLANYQPEDELPVVTTPISVIIAARNEYENLKQNLPLILDQQYPDYEVVVVNDCSYDQSEVILEEYAKQYPNLKIVTITEHVRFKTGKKFALTLGIKAAKNEHLLFTDADCQPASVNWITRMAARYVGNTQIVLGYSPYIKTSGFLNSFIRFETIKTAISYLSATLKGDAYMGIGRNLSYTKTLFFANKGFAAHMHVMSGDDDLFVNQNATEDNTVIEIHPEAHMWTDSKVGLGAYYKQKKRHMGVGKLYKNSHRRFLSFDAMSGFLFYVSMILCLVFKFEGILILGFFVLRLLMQAWFYNKTFKKLRGADLIWWLPFFDLIYYLYLKIFGLIGTFTKTTKWK
jgi:glycosyltransferase involved in cell wall biosynthesis